MAQAEPQEVSKEVPKTSRAKQKEKTPGPVIEYFGEGAESLKVTIDPKAVHVRVYANGQVVTDY